jgi:hypothetical protein
MAKTRKPHHPSGVRHTRHKRKRNTRGTHRLGGTHRFFRLFKRSTVHPDHPFEEIEDDDARVEDEHSRWLYEDPKVYMQSFYSCKKSDRETRRLRRGICGTFTDAHGFEYDPSAYILTATLKSKLITKIKARLLERLIKRKQKYPETINRLFDYFRNENVSIVKKAVDDFYVRTQPTKQTLIDKKENKNKIPISNSTSVVFPAKFYLTDYDMKDLIAEAKMINENMQKLYIVKTKNHTQNNSSSGQDVMNLKTPNKTELFREIVPTHTPRLQPQTKESQTQHLSINHVHHFPLHKREVEEEEVIFSVG